MYIFFKSRPNDSRMLVALGESYEKLSQQVEAKKVRTPQQSDTGVLEFTFLILIISSAYVQCYWRAYSVGDVEKMALLKLAK